MTEAMKNMHEENASCFHQGRQDIMHNAFGLHCVWAERGTPAALWIYCGPPPWLCWSADGYKTLLTSFEFCFLLYTFISVFSYSDVSFRTLQNMEFDMQFCLFSIDDNTQRHGNVRAVYRQLHSKIMNNSLTQLRNIFKEPQKFCDWTDSYIQHFKLWCKEPSTDRLNFLAQKELTESMQQLYHLTCLVLTICISTSSVKWSFLALKCIRHFLGTDINREGTSLGALI